MILIVSDVQRYKIWEQFTTSSHITFLNLLLFQTCKDTKFESNSQPKPITIKTQANCFRRAKIQNLRAIHNYLGRTYTNCFIVSDVQRYKIWEQFTTNNTSQSLVSILFQTCKDTKFESNSQHRFKIVFAAADCFRRAKIQNLRAIHNTTQNWLKKNGIVSDVQRYKIWEQFTTCYRCS